MRTISRGRIVAFLALVAALLAPSLSQQLFAETQKEASQGEPTLAVDPAAGKEPTPVASPAAGKKPCPCDAKVDVGKRLDLPYSCPKFPIATFDEFALYQSERHAVAECAVPELDYVYGSYSFPQYCPTCNVPGYCDPSDDVNAECCKQGKGFLGLPYKIPHDHTFLLPKGPVRRNSLELALDPAVFNRFLKFTDIDGGTRIVKVFKYRVDLGLIADPPTTSNPIVTHIALECQPPPSVTPDDVINANRTPLMDTRHPEIVECYVYRLQYKNEKILTLVEGD